MELANSIEWLRDLYWQPAGQDLEVELTKAEIVVGVVVGCSSLIKSALLMLVSLGKLCSWVDNGRPISVGEDKAGDMFVVLSSILSVAVEL